MENQKKRGSLLLRVPTTGKRDILTARPSLFASVLYVHS
jgi:hypothetical protein